MKTAEMTAKRADVDALGASLLPAVQNVGVCLSGAVLGACVSFIANCTLVEISLNPFFGFVGAQCLRSAGRS